MVLWSQELFTEKFFGEPEWFFYDIAVKEKKVWSLFEVSYFQIPKEWLKSKVSSDRERERETHLENHV